MVKRELRIEELQRKVEEMEKGRVGEERRGEGEKRGSGE